MVIYMWYSLINEYELGRNEDCVQLLEDATRIHDLMAHEYELNTS